MGEVAENNDEGARRVIEQLWLRARINAFAHKEAMLEYAGKDSIFFQCQIVFSLLGILAIILVYIISTQSGGANDHNTWSFWLALIFTLLSVVFSILSLYFSIMNNHMRLGIKAEEHKYLLNSYQHLAQRAREVKWPDKPSDEVIELLKDLERDFALLKARGNEPLDKHYDAAHVTFNKVRSDKEIHVAQSFDLVEDGESKS